MSCETFQWLGAMETVPLCELEKCSSIAGLRWVLPTLTLGISCGVSASVVLHGGARHVAEFYEISVDLCCE